MAGRSVSAAIVLGFLVVAAFCMAEASAATPGLLEAKVKLTLRNKCNNAVRLLVDVQVLDCKKGSEAVLGPVVVKLELLNLLKLQLFVFGKDGKLLNLNVVVKLKLLVEVLLGVTDVVLDVVEEVVSKEYKLIKLLSGTTVLAKLQVAI